MVVSTKIDKALDALKIYLPKFELDIDDDWLSRVDSASVIKIRKKRNTILIAIEQFTSERSKSDNEKSLQEEDIVNTINALNEQVELLYKSSLTTLTTSTTSTTSSSSSTKKRKHTETRQTSDHTIEDEYVFDNYLPQPAPEPSTSNAPTTSKPVKKKTTKPPRPIVQSKIDSKSNKDKDNIDNEFKNVDPDFIPFIKTNHTTIKAFSCLDRVTDSLNSIRNTNKLTNALRAAYKEIDKKK